MVRTGMVMGVVGVVVLITATAWGGPKMNPGKWEITTKTEMAGMPSQSITHTQCIANDDLVPMSDDANQECQVKNIKISGNTVFWEISCGGQGGQGGQMDGTGEVTYNGDTMKGKMEMTIQGMNMKVTNILAGKRIGPCDGQSSSSTFSPAPQASKSQEVEPQTQHKESKVEETVAHDARDVGQAAKDEAKRGTMDEVRKGVRGLFKKVFE